jgi:hypothetical protein
MTSANTRSMRLKYNAPLMSRIVVVIDPGQIKDQGIGVPSKHALKPSITATIGFRE